MLVKKIAVPILSVIMLLAQISPTYALTANEIKGLMDQTPSIVLEVYDVPSAEPITVAVAQTTQYFSDVPSNTWYAKDVHEARRLGIIDGVGNNLYKPLENITYAQYLKIISAVLDETVNSKPVSNPWYDRYIDSCRNIGAVGKNEVVPATIAIPREVMIRYTCMALGIEPYLGNEIVFADVKAEDAAYINAAYNEYLTEGGGRLPDGTKKFGFGEYATRAQLASMALRIKAYNENPEAYKAQAAIAREAADKAWEEQNEDLVDKAGLVKAEEIFNEIPIYQKNTNIGLKFGNTGYTLTDASLFAYNFLEVFLNYDGTDIKSMDEREAELLKYVTPGSAGDIAKSKQRAIETKDKCEIELFLSADRIEIKDGAFHVHAVVYDYVTNDVYKAYLGIGGHPVNTNDLAIGRWEFDLVK